MHRQAGAGEAGAGHRLGVGVRLPGGEGTGRWASAVRAATTSSSVNVRSEANSSLAVVARGRRAPVASHLVEGAERLEQDHLRVELDLGRDVAGEGGQLLDRPDVVEHELEGPALQRHDLLHQRGEVAGQHLVDLLLPDQAQADEHLADGSARALGLLGDQRALQAALVERAARHQQLAEARGARAPGVGDAPALKAQAGLGVVGPEPQGAGAAADVDELDDVDDARRPRGFPSGSWRLSRP